MVLYKFYLLFIYEPSATCCWRSVAVVVKKYSIVVILKDVCNSIRKKCMEFVKHL